MKESFEEKRKKAAVELGIAETGIPRHAAIIMDGNGRWATERGLNRFEGHREGGKVVEKVVLRGVYLGMECMTLYSFSMQNWRRPRDEVDYLMHLYSRYLAEIRPVLIEHNVRLVHLGHRDRLPGMVLDELDKTMEITSVHDGMVLALALNYGSRTEILDAAKTLAGKCKSGELSPDDIDEKLFENELYTTGLPDPDIVIRTSGEQRLSNFLLWQISYAEFYITQTYWPDFEPADLDEAVMVYAKRARRFGDVKANPGI